MAMFNQRHADLLGQAINPPLHTGALGQTQGGSIYDPSPCTTLTNTTINTPATYLGFSHDELTTLRGILEKKEMTMFELLKVLEEM